MNQPEPDDDVLDATTLDDLDNQHTVPAVDTPYLTAAGDYWRAGWRGVLPLPPHAKAPVPKGWTGRDGIWPSYADIDAWASGSEGHGNIALRLPHHVIGLDVDAYGDKAGAATIATAEAAWGPLPPTWRTTSREDGVSGIQLFRVPEQLAWPGELGPGTEIIQFRHRYAVVWPSIHPEGRTYRWIGPDGITYDRVPDVEDLPDLPAAWVDGLTHRRTAVDVATVDLNDAQIASWLTSLPAGEPCRAVRRALERYSDDLRSGATSRHDAAMKGSKRLAHLGAEGHAGVMTALGDLRKEFMTAVMAPSGSSRRDEGDARAEWMRMLKGAVELVAAVPAEAGEADPCVNPFQGLLDAAAVASGGGEVAWLGAGAPAAPAGPAMASADVPLVGPVDLVVEQAEARGEVDQREHTSWWPRDLHAALSGEQTDPPPAALLRTDGQALLYPAKVNGIIGESESGKSWIALHAVAQELQAGRAVTYIDFEDTVAGIVSRLQALAVDEQLIGTHLRYINPDEAWSLAAGADLDEHLNLHSPHLVVLDGLNAAMTLMGLDINDNGDATTLFQRLMRPLAERGAVVVYIDHVPKNAENRGKGGIGAQAKRAMTSGAIFSVEVIKEFGKGQDGRLRMRVDKDRPGFVRGISAPGKPAYWAADVVITSVGEGLTIAVEAPDAVSGAPGEAKRPTHLMQAVSAYLLTFSGEAWVAKKTIEDGVSGRAENIRKALDVLVVEGHLERRSGARGSVEHRLLKPFSEAYDVLNEPTSSTSSHLVPTSSGRGGAHLGSDLVPSPPPLRGGRGSDGVPGDVSEGSKTARPRPTVQAASEEDLIDAQIIDGRLVNTRTGEVIA